MGTILPAIGGVVLLVVAGIYWKLIKPKRDAKKKAEEIKKANAARRERNLELKTFVESRILPKVPPQGIQMAELNRKILEEAIQRGEVLDGILYRAAMEFASSKDAGLLAIRDDGLVTLGWKGREKATKSIKEPATK